jgi:hypothetical protein
MKPFPNLKNSGYALGVVAIYNISFTAPNSHPRSLLQPSITTPPAPSQVYQKKSSTK